MLTAQQAALWQKIVDFQLDDPDAAFKFSERLARENGWNLVYTRRVITEYKRFIFLCCISEHGVTPSDAVDQAWHLHLTFTRSYWIDLCRDTLGKEIHHNPTKGGSSEAVKYDAFYTDTNKLYEEAFQSKPPLDIWPDNAVRFTDIDFQRINTRCNWVIPKPKVTKRWPLWALLLLSAVISIQATNNEIFVVCFLGCFIVLAIVSYKREIKMMTVIVTEMVAVLQRAVLIVVMALAIMVILIIQDMDATVAGGVDAAVVVQVALLLAVAVAAARRLINCLTPQKSQH